MERNVPAMVFVLIAAAPVMQPITVKVVSMQSVLIIVASMDSVIWKPIVVFVMKGGLVRSFFKSNAHRMN